MKRSTCIALACAAVLCGPQAGASGAKGPVAKGPGRQIGPAFIPTFPDVDCKSGNSTNPHVPELCTAKSIRVKVKLIPAENGLPSFCIAYMPYNRLSLHTGTGGTTTITWTLDPAEKYEFAGTGIAPTKDSASDAADLLDLQPVTDPKRVTVLTKATNAVGKEIHHLPVVVARVSVGAPVPCVGIDPIIINNAD